jgi:riboflavin kinase / FMN adenylyltransferase
MGQIFWLFKGKEFLIRFFNHIQQYGKRSYTFQFQFYNKQFNIYCFSLSFYIKFIILPVIFKIGSAILKIFRDINDTSVLNPVATIGIFDGVHLAHRAIIEKLNNTAKKVSGESVIVTLWPHPRIILNGKGDPTKLINTLEEKIELLETAGVDNLVILPFSRDFASTSFDEFVRDILFKKLNIRHLVVGYNHQFGKNREGNFNRLVELSDSLGFTIEQLQPVILGNDRVSSSTIRKLISLGSLERANELLGYYFYLTGNVVEGRKLGTQIGFPTANIEVSNPDKIIPATGVYAVLVKTDGRTFMGMMNIGYRPTVEDQPNKIVMEVNLIDFLGDLYNKSLQVTFIKKIRDEQKFNSIDALRDQILHDKETAVNILEKLKKH